MCPSSLGARPSSLGYHSESPGEGETSSGESEGIEYAEDYAVLEDEGVTRMSRGKYAYHKVRVMFTVDYISYASHFDCMALCGFVGVWVGLSTRPCSMSLKVSNISHYM